MGTKGGGKGGEGRGGGGKGVESLSSEKCLSTVLRKRARERWPRMKNTVKNREQNKEWRTWLRVENKIKNREQREEWRTK